MVDRNFVHREFWRGSKSRIRRAPHPCNWPQPQRRRTDGEGEKKKKGDAASRPNPSPTIHHLRTHPTFLTQCPTISRLPPDPRRPTIPPPLSHCRSPTTGLSTALKREVSRCCTWAAPHPSSHFFSGPAFCIGAIPRTEARTQVRRGPQQQQQSRRYIPPSQICRQPRPRRRL